MANEPEWVEAALSSSLKARHREIFDWVADALGKTKEQLLKEMLVSSVMREAAAYREAINGPSATTKGKV